MKRIKSIILILIAAAVMAGCSPQNGSPEVAVTSAVKLTPYSTATAIPTATATPINAPTATPQPTFTPTPRIYVVKEKDTLSVIAFKNGITVEQLKAANPDVNPYIMSVGTKLIIPAVEATSLTPQAPTATVLPLDLASPRCYPSATGGLYCFGSITNNSPQAAQNVNVIFTLTDLATGEQKSQAALLPLSILESSTQLPLFTYFAPAAPQKYEINLTLQQAAGTDLPTPGIVLHDSQVVISTGGFSAQITGEGVLTETAESAKTVTFTFAALDENQQVVGIRRLQAEIDLSKGSLVPYSVTVYSTSEKITQVLVYAETLP